jgi:hypothetical protein
VQYLYLQGDDHLTFEGGGMILKKHFLQGYYEQKNTCTNKLGGGGYPAPVFGGEKCCKIAWLQGSI